MNGSAAPGRLIGILGAFPDIRFDLLADPGVHPHDLTALAGRFANLTVSGTCWRNASASGLAETLGHRVQSAPAVKVSAFSSDAASVEWLHGRLQFVKKSMGSALGWLIEDGFFEEDEIPPLIRQILHDSPRNILGLGDPA